MKLLTTKLIGSLIAVWLLAVPFSAQANHGICICHSPNKAEKTHCADSFEDLPLGHQNHLEEGSDGADVCQGDETDSDGDGVIDHDDNCPVDVNPDQDNADGDAHGDVCDPDDDNDGVLDDDDNCPINPNPGQEDNDIADGEDGGDACDLDDDNDGVLDKDDPVHGEDNCQFVPNPDQLDEDTDDVGDACDSDIDLDEDGVDDSVDNCLGVFNPLQEDQDNDQIGDACDDDVDGDGVDNDADNCEFVPNNDQANLDDDEFGDACDPDVDGDGVCESDEGVVDVCIPGPDNCPADSNPDQQDSDGDGFGDICDNDSAGDFLDSGECEGELLTDGCIDADKAVFKAKSFRKMVWKWKGEAGSLTASGTPAAVESADAYSFCVYINGERVRNSLIPAGAFVKPEKAGWRTKTRKDGSLKKHKYKSKSSTPDGVKKAVVKNGVKLGKDKAVVKSLFPPTFPLDTISADDKIVVQLRNPNGSLCLQSTHAEPFNKSTSSKLKDKYKVLMK